MKNFERPRKKRKILFPVLIFLLAVLCVGGTELFVCAFQDPALYSRLTAPVRAVVRRLSEAERSAWDHLSRTADDLDRRAAGAADQAAARLWEFWESLTPEPEQDEIQPDEIQLVDDEIVTPPPRPPAVHTITALTVQDGQAYLTGGTQEFFYYNQTDDLWANEPYGSDRLGGYGCGPTAMAMVVSSLTDSTVDPAQMARHCVDHGYWAKKHGSYWSIVPGVAEDFGLTCTSLLPEEADPDLVSQYLSTGSLMVVLIGPGHFTNGGHFIVLRGITLDGGILVADPASEERSLTAWDLDLILEELSAGRHNGGPLWVISPDPFQ